MVGRIGLGHHRAGLDRVDQRAAPGEFARRPRRWRRRRSPRSTGPSRRSPSARRGTPSAQRASRYGMASCRRSPKPASKDRLVVSIDPPCVLCARYRRRWRSASSDADLQHTNANVLERYCFGIDWRTVFDQNQYGQPVSSAITQPGFIRGRYELQSFRFADRARRIAHAVRATTAFAQDVPAQAVTPAPGCRDHARARPRSQADATDRDHRRRSRHAERTTRSSSPDRASSVRT